MARGDNFKGARPDGAGRKPGSKNFKTIMMDELLENSEWAQKMEDGTFITPANFWASIINDPTKDDSIRHECSKAMAPYFYRKQPQVTETKITTDDTENFNGFNITVIKGKSNE